MIPFLDLVAQYDSIREEVEAALRRIFATQRFILGPEGEALEQEFARACGARHAIGCSSGSDALLLALAALEVGPSDAVVTSPMSFFATAGAPARLGARVDFVDVEPETLNMDPRALERFLRSCRRGRDGVLREPREGKRVRAVIPVHIYGRPVAWDAISSLAREHGLAIVEDAAQAFGARFRGRAAGGLGAEVGCFSFYPTKNLGAAGDAGLVTTDDDALATRLRRLRVHGQETAPYLHVELGWNARLDEIQAAVIRIKLKRVESWNRARVEIARRYDELLAGTPARPLAPPAPGVEPCYHQYVIRAPERDALKDALAREKIGSQVYYPVPLHLQPVFKGYGYREGDLPVVETAVRDVLALPIYPELPADSQRKVVDAIQRFYVGRPSSV